MSRGRSTAGWSRIGAVGTSENSPPVHWRKFVLQGQPRPVGALESSPYFFSRPYGAAPATEVAGYCQASLLDALSSFARLDSRGGCPHKCLSKLLSLKQKSPFPAYNFCSRFH